MVSPICVCFVVFACIVCVVLGQLNPPVFIGQNTPAVPNGGSNQWMDPNFQIPSIPSRPANNGQTWQPNGNQFGPQANSNQFGPTGANMNNVGPNMNTRNQFARPNGTPFRPVRLAGRMGNQFRQTGSMFQTVVSPQNQPWAPGEPRWAFPASRPMRETCQRRGCPVQGTQCVFWGGMCPTSVRRTPCRCERGCRVDTQFIPFGQSKVMDQCNNVCHCNSREGIARCSTRRC